MKTRLSLLRRRALAGVAALLLSASANTAHAVFVFTLAPSGANLLLTGVGTVNTSSLSTDGLTHNPGPSINAADGDVAGGSGVAIYYSGLEPFTFGPSNVNASGFGSGNFVGVSSGALFLPYGYTSGAPLSNLTTFANNTLSSLGLTPGTYTDNFGSGTGADSVVLNIVPEPSPWALLGLGAGALGFVTLRRRRA